MQKLKPCPFCGGRASHRQFTGNGFTLPRVAYTEVRCDKCEISTGPHQLLHHNGDRPLDAWNTRPAAPVVGLETVAYECQFNDTGTWQPIPKKTVAKYSVDHPVRELVTRSQSEAIMAAERAESERKLSDAYAEANKWRDKYNREVLGLNNEGDPIGGDSPSGLRHDVETLKADNAALTAKAKGVEDYIKGLIDDRNVAQERAEALETQLAAVRRSLQCLLACPAIADECHSDPEWGCEETVQAIQKARAALEASHGE